MPDDNERHGLEVLSSAECLRLLEKGRIGRVGFVSDGQPHVLPVNYLASDAGEVVFRTTDGSVLTEVAGGPAAFEIDGYDEQARTGWSVCVHGPGREITDAGDVLARAAPRAERHHLGAGSARPLVRDLGGPDHRTPHPDDGDTR